MVIWGKGGFCFSLIKVKSLKPKKITKAITAIPKTTLTNVFKIDERMPVGGGGPPGSSRGEAGGGVSGGGSGWGINGGGTGCSGGATGGLIVAQSGIGGLFKGFSSMVLLF